MLEVHQLYRLFSEGELFLCFIEHDEMRRNGGAEVYLLAFSFDNSSRFSGQLNARSLYPLGNSSL